jgi:hypothetical protein
VAQKLNSQYGFSYDNLKVLLGGWSTWKQKHAEDPAGYPTVPENLGGAAVPPAGSDQIVLTPAAPAATTQP